MLNVKNYKNHFKFYKPIEEANYLQFPTVLILLSFQRYHVIYQFGPFPTQFKANYATEGRIVWWFWRNDLLNLNLWISFLEMYNVLDFEFCNFLIYYSDALFYEHTVCFFWLSYLWFAFPAYLFLETLKNQWRKCKIGTAQKMKFSIKDFADLVTFTEEILNGKLHFLCSERTDRAFLIWFDYLFEPKNFLRNLFVVVSDKKFIC